MNPEVIVGTIQVILAPAVMVTSCAILLGGILGHYTGINQRLRAMAQERLQILRASGASASTDTLATERLDEIDTQIPDLIDLYQQVRNAILALYLATAIFLADMLIIALAVVVSLDWLGVASLLGFLIGTTTLLWSILLMVREIWAANRATQFEITRVLNLK
ncbi:MAG: hypothetical protein FOGNACKC_04860 [Anaerolineae bacterium]|nr:hypothetical protein [Anaerolineae bacterium]